MNSWISSYTVHSTNRPTFSNLHCSFTPGCIVWWVQVQVWLFKKRRLVISIPVNISWVTSMKSGSVTWISKHDPYWQFQKISTPYSRQHLRILRESPEVSWTGIQKAMGRGVELRILNAWGGFTSEFSRGVKMLKASLKALIWKLFQIVNEAHWDRC